MVFLDLNVRLNRVNGVLGRLAKGLVEVQEVVLRRGDPVSGIVSEFTEPFGIQ